MSNQAFSVAARKGSPLNINVCSRYRGNLHIWQKRYGNLGIKEVKELRQLPDENARLKPLPAEPALDKHILSESFEKGL